MSRATSAAILFSNPSRRSFENGRLLGSAQTRSSRAPAEQETSTAAAKVATLRETEHIQRASLGGRLLEVAHGVDEAERGGAVARIEVAGHDRAGPAADARQDRHVLAAVGAAVGGRLADDPGAGLELPQQLTGLGVKSFEPAVHGSVEHDVAGSRDGPAPQREILLHLPTRALGRNVTGGEHTAMAAGTGLHAHFGA